MDQNTASYIDHAVLHPTQTDQDLHKECAMCQKMGVASVCVKPYMVPQAAELLADSTVKVSTVIGFPHGASATETKSAEARWACLQGASELDMVVNIGRVLSEDWIYVELDIEAVVQEAQACGALTKVIFECGLLPNDEQKIRLCEISRRVDASFVKTSTGFGLVKQSDGTLKATGATEHDVTLMRKHCGTRVGVKASGGIRNLAKARRFIELGATRLGTSSTQQIMSEEAGKAPPTRESLTNY